MNSSKNKHKNSWKFQKMKNTVTGGKKLKEREGSGRAIKSNSALSTSYQRLSQTSANIGNSEGAPSPRFLLIAPSQLNQLSAHGYRGNAPLARWAGWAFGSMYIFLWVIKRWMYPDSGSEHVKTWLNARERTSSSRIGEPEVKAALR